MSKKIIEDFEKVIAFPTDELAHKLSIFFDSAEEIQNTLRKTHEDLLVNERHDDECDCVECQARTEKGGLDHDPTSDEEEFEEHERQVMRDTGIDGGKK